MIECGIRNIRLYTLIRLGSITGRRGRGIAADHYPTMSLQEICDLPVRKLADKDCVLFLWVTFPQLREGLSVIQAWGFQYKTVAFV